MQVVRDPRRPPPSLMPIKLLMDECLSPELVDMARAAGHLEANCVRNLGLSGSQDWQLMRRVIAGDYTLVTHNARDFRGRTPGRAGGGLHAKQALHAGLVCLNTEIGMDIDKQRDLFEIALEQLAGCADLVNRALEVTEREDGRVDVVWYDIPSEPG